MLDLPVWEAMLFLSLLDAFFSKMGNFLTFEKPNNLKHLLQMRYTKQPGEYFASPADTSHGML